jgi:hypothetical protein
MSALLTADITTGDGPLLYGQAVGGAGAAAVVTAVVGLIKNKMV